MNLHHVARLHESLSAGYLEQHRLLPLRCHHGHLVVAHAGPPDLQALAELSGLFRAKVELVEVPEEELLLAVQRSYGLPAHHESGLVVDRGDGDPAGGEGTHDLEALANQPPVVRLVNMVLSDAVDAEASDVHLEAEGDGLRVRYRIDGVLQAMASPPAHLRPAIVSRLKIMAELDIAERRLPQDGRIRLRIAGRELDVRVSTLPTLHGESIVLRLLDARRRYLGLESLGMAEDTYDQLVRRATRTQGVILATGPTGSGKTTTLYALLDRIRTGREKAVSVEDPVEYELPGVAQVPVQARSGLTFARALRSILRQDPDLLMVGEMRDAETAEICIQAALTGHLVLSTLHTNDAPSALTRLLDLGIADYLVTSTVEAVLAQRLVRRCCVACAEVVPTDAATLREMDADGVTIREVRRGKGCPACRGTGFRGRTGIYELLMVDDSLRSELLKRRGAGPLRALAVKRGMRMLRADGWRQVAAGVTVPEEVLRVTAV